MPTESAQLLLRILLVEDDEDMRQLMGAVLRSTGAHALTLTATGESGLVCLRAETYHLLITDIGLPGLSGLEMLDEAEREGRLPSQTAIVVCSAMEACDRRGACFMRKPVDTNAIRRIVRARSESAS